MTHSMSRFLPERYKWDSLTCVYYNHRAFDVTIHLLISDNVKMCHSSPCTASYHVGVRTVLRN